MLNTEKKTARHVSFCERMPIFASTSLEGAESLRRATNTSVLVPGPVVSTQTRPGRTTHGLQLSPDDISRLEPGAWLSTNLLDAVANVANASEASRFTYPLRIFLTQNFLALPEVPVLRPEVADHAWLVGLVVNTSPPTCRGSHWVAYWARINHLPKVVEVLFFDSFGVHTNKHAEVMHRLPVILSLPSYEFRGPVNMACPQQRNGCDCGVYAAAVLLRLWDTDTLPWEETSWDSQVTVDAGEMRARLGAFIGSGIKTS